MTYEQQTEIEIKQQDYEQQILKILENERTLKENISMQAKWIEDLEWENTNEKALRVKLEEEFR